jgi:hypothetical protein
MRDPDSCVTSVVALMGEFPQLAAGLVIDAVVTATIELDLTRAGALDLTSVEDRARAMLRAVRQAVGGA